MKSHLHLKVFFTFLIVTITVADNNNSQAQSFSNWQWINGANTINQSAIYGSKGTPTSYTRPGGRNNQANWIDSNNDLWLFGGHGNIANSFGRLNDLWKFDVLSNRWTWIGGPTSLNVRGIYGEIGVAAETNWPGSRFGAMTWVDTDGNFWLFGGHGDGESQYGYLNDLWVYSFSAGTWIWMGGSKTPNQLANHGTRGVPASTNNPGSRRDAGTWVDNAGNLWMFGGYLQHSNLNGPLNDLWKYEVFTGNWIWMHGANVTHPRGSYGTFRVPSAQNSPGGRDCPAVWKTDIEEIWLFGGHGYGQQDFGLLNDLWKYNQATNQWTWIKGSNLVNREGSYGTREMAADLNEPGGRNNPLYWLHKDGRLCLFGGWHGTTGHYNDLWAFDINTFQWTWLKGSNNMNQHGVYGSFGVPADTSSPGSRGDSVAWQYKNLGVYLFGGSGYGVNSGEGRLGDLWLLNTSPQSRIDWIDAKNY